MYIPDMHNVPWPTQLAYCAVVVLVLAIVRMIFKTKG
jgi:hypothetical protein